MAGDRAADALVRRGRGDRLDEALARGADQQRQPERLKSVEPRQADHALLRRLAEADAWIEHDMVTRNAGALGDRRACAQRRRSTSAMMSMAASARSRLCITITGTPRSATSGAISGIVLQAPDVVDDGRAVIECPGRDLGLDGVDRNRHAERDRPPAAPASAAPVRRPPIPAVGRHRAGSIPRRYRGCRRLASAISAAWAMRARRIEELAAVGERFRRDVEDAHHQRPAELQQPAAAPALRRLPLAVSMLG